MDVGCGLGDSTLAMAQALPKALVVGVDCDPYSVATAQSRAASKNLSNVRFICCSVEAMEKRDEWHQGFDLVLAYDVVHDMGRPREGLSAMIQVLSSQGFVLWSEPKGHSDPLLNRNPRSRFAASLSPYHCLTVSLAQQDGAGLGNMIGEDGARELAELAGCTQFEKVVPQKGERQLWYLVR
eukprot:NODE_1226_length_1628_cov_34.694744_g1091_i0.p1 GENE.NODE_1226_length_1628_cov_34.694744_g1091_i0~~NODE_1226_length_1628_cov_34.694744_g1091_i0.p1  ORF type:complete len:182 (+),score=39.65 NODE_1226_length_1628_cov_34.694744_g1091_i0:998-1543(+)